MNNLSNKKMYFKCCIALFSALLMNGCGEFAYKRGASVSDLENTKKVCLAKDSNQTAIEKCMEDNGWIVQSLGSKDPVEPEPALEAFINPDNRQAGTPLTANTKGISTDKPSSGTEQLPQAVKKVADPMEIFKISSWWKLGGGAENLKIATSECVAKLGEIHRPNNQTNKVTRSLLLCMSEKGWRGLREK